MNMQFFLEQLAMTSPTLLERIGRGKTFFLDPTNGKATGNAGTPLAATSSLLTAIAKMTTGQNDYIKYIAGATGINLSAALDWSLNCSHLHGEGSSTRVNSRSRIGHTANFSPFITISGYGNTFKDLYTMHGRGNAGNLIGHYITGARNKFERVHFGGPMHATEAGTAGYRLMKVSATASELEFDGCTFGIDTVPLTAAVSLFEIETGADCRFFFKDCTFLTAVNAAGGAGATFLKFAAGVGEGYMDFRSCKFLNIGSTAMTLGIDGTGLGNLKLYFDANSGFSGVTNVCTAGTKANVFFQTAAGLYANPA
jgi:hypothetical protein